MDIITTAMEMIFDDPNMAVDVVFTPAATQVPASIRAIRKAPDDVSMFQETRVQSPTSVFEIRISDVEEPKRGDRILVGDETFEVQGRPKRDQERLLWALDTHPVS